MIENPVEWFQNKMGELDNDLRRKDVLRDMKSMILNWEKKVLNDIIHKTSINPMFECISNCDEQELEIASVIIPELLSELRGGELLDTYGESIHQCLSSQSDVLKPPLLKLIEKNLNDTIIVMLVNKYSFLLIDAVNCIASEERSTAQGAISLFIKLGTNKVGLTALYSPLVLNKLNETLTKSDIIRFRVYEIVVAVSKLSENHLSQSVSSGLMEHFLNELFSLDVLIQLNVLQLLSDLATSNHGLSYLQEKKVIKKLVDKLLKINEEPFSVMLLPGLIEFFGNICTSQPETFTNEFPQIMDLLFSSINTNDEVLLGVIITTVGKIGLTNSGRFVLAKYGDQLQLFFRKMGQILTSKSNITISALNSLSELVKNINNDLKVNLISKNWFQSIKPDALDSVVNISKLPFVEYRLPALALLKAISTQRWGTEKLIGYPGMMEFLTDRSNEFNKECKELKYEIILNMVQCSNIEKMASEQVLLTLREYVREGPFFVPVHVEMATEGAL